MCERISRSVQRPASITTQPEKRRLTSCTTDHHCEAPSEGKDKRRKTQWEVAPKPSQGRKASGPSADSRCLRSLQASSRLVQGKGEGEGEGPLD